MNLKTCFSKFAKQSSDAVASPRAFIVASVLVVGWAACGPVFDFSDTWQLFINTISTISTGLIVFLLQNSQNRNDKATHRKLDELLYSSNARNKLVGIEEQPDEELEKLAQEFRQVREEDEE